MISNVSAQKMQWWHSTLSGPNRHMAGQLASLTSPVLRVLIFAAPLSRPSFDYVAASLNAGSLLPVPPIIGTMIRAEGPRMTTRINSSNNAVQTRCVAREVELHEGAHTQIMAPTRSWQSAATRGTKALTTVILQWKLCG